jgi:hypothetical protein
MRLLSHFWRKAEIQVESKIKVVDVRFDDLQLFSR